MGCLRLPTKIYGWPRFSTLTGVTLTSLNNLSGLCSVQLVPTLATMGVRTRPSSFSATASNTAFDPEIGPVSVPSVARKSSFSSSFRNLLRYSLGSGDPMSYAVDSGCNRPAMLRSCSWHPRSTRTGWRSGSHREDGHKRRAGKIRWPPVTSNKMLGLPHEIRRTHGARLPAPHLSGFTRPADASRSASAV